MPPRIPFLAALRQPSNLIKSQTAYISTSKPSQALRTDSSATSNLLALDDQSSSSNSPFSKTRRPRDATSAAADVYDRLHGTVSKRMRLEEELRQKNESDDYSRQLSRRWKAGDVYAPHDLSPSEMRKWRKSQMQKKDLVDMLGLKPLDMYRNFSVISEFMTSHGRIKRAFETGLRPPNQRKMAKAIRRAIGLGIHPSVHKHPEILLREHQRYNEQNTYSLKKDRNI
ncbi:ribosomal protein S18 [Hypoxylon trugodes]|uniref:ribosomal protein S18 n=1 Tax=Hypoxylon trugodes TaxID=326681 RepID=UPI002197EAE7|nr:ribosomal protein S18 [Hypoxylon trugodes]KAI1389991.1 ribosomal protein S18 [Hypoxylon trugodes]